MRAWVELPNVGRHEALAAWTNPAVLKDWWGGELQAELEAGGPYVVRFTELGQTMRGRVLGYEPGERLAFSWEWEHEAENSPRQVSIRVVEVGSGSRIEIEHGPYGDSETERVEAAGSHEGWQHFLPRLASRLAGHS